MQNTLEYIRGVLRLVLSIAAIALCSCKKTPQVEIVDILGTSQVCLGDTNVQYTLISAAPVDYVLWTVPEGAWIKEGQGTTTIKVNFGQKQGEVCAELYIEGKKVNTVDKCLSVSFGVPGEWCRGLNFEDGKVGGAVAFSIAAKGYIVSGYSVGENGQPQHKAFLWEYDPASGKWTPKASLPTGEQRSWATGFSIGDKGYIATGRVANDVNYQSFVNDFWEYNPATNTWTERASIPFPTNPPNSPYPGTDCAFSFSIGGKGYVGGGESFNLLPRRKLFAYDPQQNMWIARNDVPFNSTISSTSFVIGNKAYVGLGYYQGVTDSDSLFEYDPLLDQWAEKAHFPGGKRLAAVAFSLNNKGYVGTGYDHNIAYSNFWRYDPVNDTWETIPSIGEPIAYSSAFVVDNKAYVVGGNPTVSSVTNKVWIYTQPAN